MSLNSSIWLVVENGAALCTGRSFNMGPAHFLSYRKFWETGKHTMVRKISGAAEHMCSCLMSLPFTQADTDYCSDNRPACFTAKSVSVKASRSTDPPVTQHIQSKSPDTQHIQYTSGLLHLANINSSIHSFKCDTEQIPNQQGLCIGSACEKSLSHPEGCLLPHLIP